MAGYQIGEKVVHSPEGVCEIQEICQLEMEQTKRAYYRLKPMKSQCKMLYIPVEKMDSNVRPLKTKEELKRILLTEPGASLLKHINPQKRMNMQNQAIRQDDSDMLIRLIKTYRRKGKDKQISVGDARWLKEAEGYLFSEIAEVLKCDYNLLQQNVRHSQEVRCAYA